METYDLGPRRCPTSDLKSPCRRIPRYQFSSKSEQLEKLSSPRVARDLDLGPGRCPTPNPTLNLKLPCQITPRYQFSSKSEQLEHLSAPRGSTRVVWDLDLGPGRWLTPNPILNLTLPCQKNPYILIF